MLIHGEFILSDWIPKNIGEEYFCGNIQSTMREYRWIIVLINYNILLYYIILRRYYVILRSYYIILRRYYIILRRYYIILRRYYIILRRYYIILRRYYIILRRYYIIICRPCSALLVLVQAWWCVIILY